MVKIKMGNTCMQNRQQVVEERVVDVIEHVDMTASAFSGSSASDDLSDQFDNQATLENIDMSKVLPRSLVDMWFECRIKSVYDGDTVTIVFADPVSHVFICDSLRLANIDTPELRTRNPREKAQALIAKNYLATILSSMTILLCHVTSKEKYGRLLGDLYCCNMSQYNSMTESVSTLMLKAGEAKIIHCKKYDGRTKEPWDF